MINLSKNNSKKKKEKMLHFFTLRNCAFLISFVFLIIAISSAYPVYLEEKTAQENAKQLLENFSNLAFQDELSNFQIKDGKVGLKGIIESVELINTNEEEINADEPQQLSSKPLGKPKADYTSIAKLEIEKIGLKTTVLSEWSYELLDISVNKFRGPEPNELGNFIIIGHNYSGDMHFGNLHLLELGDVINLTDLSGRKVTYEIYEILTINPDEIDKLTTYENRTLTLVTCDSSSELRIVIKSKDKIQ